MGSLLTLYRSKIVTVEPLIFLYSFARFLYVPIIDQYYYHYYGTAILKDTSFDIPEGTYCINSSLIDEYTGRNDSYKQDEAESNHLVIYTQLTGDLPAVLVAILLGPVTDRFGRKLGMLIPTFGYFMQGLGSVLLIYYRLNPYYFIAISLFSGLTGAHTTVIAACFSYVADLSSIKWRSFRIAAIEGMMAFGKLLGQLAGGFWLLRIQCNFIPLMILYTGTMAAAFIYGLIIPESLTKDKRQELVSRSKGTVRKWLEAAALFCTSFSFQTLVLYVATISLGVAVFNMLGSFHLSVYFLKAIPFEFTSLQISYYQALRSMMQSLSIFFFILFAIFKIRDSIIILFAFVINGTGNLLIGFSTRPWEVYTISCVQGNEGTVFSAGRGWASKLVRPEQQGALFSIIASVESLAAVAGSAVWSYIFPLTLDRNMRPGTTFMLIAAIGYAVVPVMILMVVCESMCLLKSGASVSPRVSKYSPSISSRTTSVYISENEEKKPLLPDRAGSINT